MRKKFIKDPQRILVIRLDSLGDAVMTLPALGSLQRRFPKARIDFLVGQSVLDLFTLFFPDSKIRVIGKNWVSNKFSLIPMASHLLKESLILRPERYDLAIDFRGDLRSILLMFLAGIPERWGRDGTGGRFLLTRSFSPLPTRHEVLENLDLVEGVRMDHQVEFPKLSFRARPRPPEFASNPPRNGRKILIHAGAGYPSKRWPAERFVALANEIRERAWGVPIFIGSQKERNILDPYRNEIPKEAIDFTGQTSFAELFGLLQTADLFIGNDSAPAHLAALLGLKSVVIFSGTSDIQKWSPWSRRCRTLHYAVPCSPCEQKICPLERHLCMEGISVNEVLQTVEEALRG